MTATRERWADGDMGLVVGRELHDGVPPGERPAWAAEVLMIACDMVRPVREVEDVLRAAERPARWGEGHVLFQRIRALTLASERTPRTSRPYRALLDIAETVAKITYNSSGRPAPFDRAAGWRLARDARRLTESLSDDLLEDRLWRALCGRGATSGPASHLDGHRA